ncbi:hypothetical protein GUJ93_ZPchr0458g22807 [Zizania palustris]|uniref:Uncharacterized protein n=1 Tax=Zizania palustris TaxID=103762 RepID=A0A8J5VEY7_ZIZPA|nr:hypothetical protein GUJ93_ZPchr0458g22807 [Zizania palustris]
MILPQRPELPRLRPSQVQKRPSTIHGQSADPRIPVHLEDVTFAKPDFFQTGSLIKMHLLEGKLSVRFTKILNLQANLTHQLYERQQLLFCRKRNLLNIPVIDAVKESLDQIQHVDSKDMVNIKIASGPKEQPNATNKNTEQSEQLETKTDVFRGINGPNSVASGNAPDVEAVSTAHNPQGSQPSTLIETL